MELSQPVLERLQVDLRIVQVNVILPFAVEERISQFL